MSFHSYRIIVLLLLMSCQPKKTSQTAAASKSVVEQKPLELTKSLQTIAFGSCNRVDKPQMMWPFIVKNQPDLWIWLGDIIYADTKDMEKMKAMYDLQKRKEGYLSLLTQCPVLGIWDDHDYGVNDGDNTYVAKAASKQLLLDFLEVPQSATVRNRKGAYQSYTIGETGKRVKVILLDARYFRDPLAKDSSGKSRYLPNTTGTILGEEQWKWLENELQNSDAQVHLLASGIQIIPEEHIYEKWANFPAERQRLFDLLVQANVSHPILLSGDRHLAEVSKLELSGLNDPLYEITASGLTHSYEAADEPNKHRIGSLTGQKNFALLHLDWSEQEVKISTEVKGVDNKTLIQAQIQ